MELSEALQAKQRIFSALGLSYVRMRSEEPRFSVGIALPERSPGNFRVAIRARSRQELDDARAQGRLAIFDSYPESELDIRITGPIVASPPGEATVASKRLSIGASIGHHLCTAGTLGFFARRNSDGVIGMVSNNHVLAMGDEGEEGDDILHPATSDHGSRALDVVGYLAGDYPRLDEETPIVDCAFARLRSGIPYDASTIAPGLRLKAEPAPLELQRDVLKKGRTTGMTRGQIISFEIDHCDVEFDFGIVVFDRQIEIASVGDEPFSRPGDSGSLIVNPDGHPVALLASATLDCRLHYANPIDEVLRVLGVTVLT
jgi:hypothetical protein